MTSYQQSTSLSMTSNTIVCGICDIKHFSKPSSFWCPECNEGLCLECKEQHGTHNHNIIPISQYETPQANVLEISQFCNVHKENLEIYCKPHDHPCCSKCIISDHQNCQDLIQLNDMIRNVKTSYGFLDIEQAMIGVVENIQKIQIDRQANLSTLKEERKMIENEIQQTRVKINQYLDNLQEAILKELYEAESKECELIDHLMDSIAKSKKEIRRYQHNLMNINQNASDLQTFLAIKQMERIISEKDEYITSLVKHNKLNRVSLSFKINVALVEIFNEIDKFGEIVISKHSTELAIKRQKEKQAQIVVGHARSKSIDNLSFVLQATIDTKLDNIRGCTLLPDGRMVFSCYKQNRVRGFNRDGSQNFDVKFSFLHCAFDITYIHNSNSIAVTSGMGKLKYVTLIDVESRKITENMLQESHTTGIVCRNNTLIYGETENVVLLMNLSTRKIHDLPNFECFDYIDAFDEKLYYTNKYENTVTCWEEWKFNDESVLKCPQGISVDNVGNVYVVGQESCNVVVIAPDGQRHRQLFSEKDGLNEPTVLHNDRTTNQLLVANKTGEAFLFQLE